MNDLLFATPWWLLGSLILAGGVIFWSGNKRQQKQPQLVGVGLIVLAVVLKTVSYFVVTDKEKVTHQTQQLVTAVQNRDWNTFSSLLDADATLSTGGGTVFPNRDAIVQGAKDDVDRYNLTNLSAHVTSIQQDETGITVDLDASSEQTSSFGYQVPSSWRLDWDRTGTEWRLHQVTCLKIMNENVNHIGQLIAK